MSEAWTPVRGDLCDPQRTYMLRKSCVSSSASNEVSKWLIECIPFQVLPEVDPNLQGRDLPMSQASMLLLRFLPELRYICAHIQDHFRFLPVQFLSLWQIIALVHSSKITPFLERTEQGEYGCSPALWDN